MNRMTSLIATIALAGVMLTASISVAAETEITYLTGRGKDDPVQWDFYCTSGRKSGTWSKIGVPSNWELQGFGQYNYGHDRPKHDEQGMYRRTFDVPQDWKAKRVFLVFEGVMTDTEVWVNGKSAGPKHQGGFYRFKYEITDLIEVGENLLEVTVSKVSSDKSVEQAERQSDYWVFGGIFRPVYLEGVPEQFIERVATDARADGTFRMDVYLNGNKDADVVKTEILDLEGNPVVSKLSPGQDSVTVKTLVTGHKPWTAETPHLYSVRVTLLKGTEAIHTRTQRFGFRTFEVRPGDGLYLNGQKIKLKGVCRHSFWPDSGRCLSRKVSYDDVRLIKAMNMNAVRMSHYPPDQHFLQACDELGLYVLDELAGWQKPPYDTEIGKKLVREMVPRDVCHPCILFWDNGNEGGWNRELDDQFALYDPQNRPVLHPWATFSDVDTSHYQSYKSMEAKVNGSTLVMPTEFLHGLYDGGHGASLEDYWDLLYNSPVGAGGFLWVLADEGVVRTDKNGQIDTDGNHAPDGIVGPYREKEGSFYAIKEIWSPIRIYPEELPADFDGTLTLENRYDFTNLKACRLEAKLARFASPTDSDDGHHIVSLEKLRGPNVRPHEKGELAVILPDNWCDADVLYVTARDPKGMEIWTWSWPIEKAHQNHSEYVATEQPDVGKTLHVEDGVARINAGDLTITFSLDSGRPVNVTVADKPITLTGGPDLIGGKVGDSKLVPLNQDGAIGLTLEYDGDMNYARWTVYSTGWVCLQYEYSLEGAFDLFGIQFDYPEKMMRRMRWLGRGPFRVWKNRTQGGMLDVWSNDYKDHTPGLTWDFPEFRGYYKDWQWVVFETDQGEITMVNETPDLYLGVYRPNDGPDPRNTRLDVPETGIALLHGIPPIGTKFQKPDRLGPTGQTNTASGRYRGKVWLHFDL